MEALLEERQPRGEVAECPPPTVQTRLAHVQSADGLHRAAARTATRGLGKEVIWAWPLVDKNTVPKWFGDSPRSTVGELGGGLSPPYHSAHGPVGMCETEEWLAF